MDTTKNESDGSVAGQGERGVRHHAQTVRELIACCRAWGPDVRILGNVRAADALAALEYMLPELEADEQRGKAMGMRECEHLNGRPHWDYWQCADCGWVLPSGQYRGRNERGFFPSMEAVKIYDKFKTYPGMGEVKPMVPNAN